MHQIDLYNMLNIYSLQNKITFFFCSLLINNVYHTLKKEYECAKKALSDLLNRFLCYATICPGSSDPFYLVTYYIKFSFC